jgi:hypothetical protein
MNPFSWNWNFSEKHMPEIKKILQAQAMHIVKIEVATPDEDMKQSTDLKIKITSGDVAVRIRRDTGFRDLTIRAKNGQSKTEIHKLREGYAQWYLYAWTCDDKISEWILVNIDAMRSAGLFDETRPIKMNTDGKTGFVAYSFRELRNAGAMVSEGKNKSPPTT